MSFGMCVCFLLIHFLMISIFYQCGVTPMVKFNIFSICFYIFMIFAVYKEWLLFSTISIYLEVGLHMTLAIIFTGWNSGFQITLIGMNVLAFYAEYTGRRLRMKHFRMVPICMIGMCLYLGSYIYLNHHPAPYELPARAEFWLSLLWGFTTFRQLFSAAGEIPGLRCRYWLSPALPMPCWMCSLPGLWAGALQVWREPRCWLS